MKVKNFEEEKIFSTHYTEEHMGRRLQTYRSLHDKLPG